MMGVGGQGKSYHARLLGRSEAGVLKILCSADPDTLQRTRFLVSQRLDRVCPALRAPTESITHGGIAAHYAELAPGEPLEEFLSKPPCEFTTCLQLALALAHAVGVLHGRDIAHGDLQACNVIVHRRGSVLEIFVIDLDNFVAPGQPPPPCLGHNLYLAPEIRLAMQQGRAVEPDIRSDLFALGVLMHEIILLRHVAAGADSDEQSFARAMTASRWIHDPARYDRPKDDLGGYPSEALNATLQGLFRRAIGGNRDDRPGAGEWAQALSDALYKVYICPRCSGPFLVDPSKTICPHCKCPFPFLRLVLPGGRAIILDRGAIGIGRSELGGSANASKLHAIFRRIGPETWCEPVGQNPTYRLARSTWHPLPTGKHVLLRQGDRLRLGDINAELAAA
jgi:serine/threonine protein kinase